MCIVPLPQFGPIDNWNKERNFCWKSTPVYVELFQLRVNKISGKKYTDAHLSFPQDCFTRWIAIASSLLQAIKTCRQACPPGFVNAFFLRINPWKFGEKKFKIDKVIQHLFQWKTH